MTEATLLVCNECGSGVLFKPDEADAAIAEPHDLWSADECCGTLWPLQPMSDAEVREAVSRALRSPGPA